MVLASRPPSREAHDVDISHDSQMIHKIRQFNSNLTWSVKMALSGTGRLNDGLDDVDYDELGFMDDSEDDPDYSGSDDISEVGYLEERQVNRIR